jgi:hypothetical protein
MINFILNDAENKTHVYYLIICTIDFYLFIMDMYNDILTKKANYHCYC